MWKAMMMLWLIWVLLLILLPHHLHVSANTEVDALIALKANLVDPHNVLETWNQSFINPCPWFHITCNTENRVTRIDLGNANLSGSLVPHLSLLRNLHYLELYSNNITGQIPRELGKLTKLVSLDLYLNHLTGPIPDTLAKLQMLRFLRLNNNQLSGHIPMSLTTIKTLQVLDLSYNRLTGPIPTNGSFQYFTPASFAHNHLNPLPIHGGPTTPAQPQLLGDET